MAYNKIAPTAPTMTGSVITYAAVPAGGLALLPGSILLVKNGAGSSITVTPVPQKTYKGYSLVATSAQVTVGAGVELAIGPIPAEIHQIVNAGDANNGYILVDFSSLTSVTYAVLNVPQ